MFHVEHPPVDGKKRSSGSAKRRGFDVLKTWKRGGAAHSLKVQKMPAVLEQLRGNPAEHSVHSNSAHCHELSPSRRARGNFVEPGVFDGSRTQLK